MIYLRHLICRRWKYISESQSFFVGVNRIVENPPDIRQKDGTGINLEQTSSRIHGGSSNNFYIEFEVLTGVVKKSSPF
jgi:hypothetical protein